MGTRRTELDRLNIDYTDMDAERSSALSKELGGIPIGVTAKGLYRIFHQGLPHYFTRLDDATGFYAFCVQKAGSGHES